MSRLTLLGPEITNGAAQVFNVSVPYRVEVTIRGDCDLLFHAWNVEDIEAKGNAAKGSKVRKTDNLETFVYRDSDNHICLPGEYFRQSIIIAAKSRQDPRSPRKSARDLVQAAVLSLTPLASLGKSTWEYEHKCRVRIQNNAITRTRPAFKSGWKATFILQVNLPEYISEEMLNSLIVDAGRLIGVGDFRPSYGRFQIVKFEKLD